MLTIDNKQRLLVLVKNAPCASLHLVFGRREKRLVFFVCEQGFDDARERRWREIIGGWARTRVLNERINGLPGYFVMRAGCILGLNCNNLRGRYHATDFTPWKKKDY